MIRDITLIKREHTYIFRYTVGEESKVLEALISKAQDPSCSFDWFDAAMVSHQLGKKVAENFQDTIKNKLKSA
jgi:hypothetical protein